MKDLFLIKDEKVGFLNVIIDTNVDIAKFNFGSSFYSEHPELGRLEDYSLYHAGKFSVDGIELFDTPVFLINGLSAYNDFVSRVNSMNIKSLDGENYVEVER